MTSFHYPLPESEPSSPWSGLSDEARTALAGVAMGPSPADQLLKPDGQATAEVNSDFQTTISEAYRRTADLFASTNSILVPELPGLEFKRVDWQYVQEGYKAYERLGMEPELVISPEGQPLTFWQGLYKGLRLWQDRVQSGATHRLQKQDDGDGLYVDGQVAKNWSGLVLESSSGQPRWNVSVVPATPKAPILQVAHEELNNTGTPSPELATLLSELPGSEAQPHTSVEAYLTLQATRLQAGKEPIDSQTYSWLDGTFTNNNNSLAAPRGRWSPGYGQVGLGWYGVGSRRGSLGARPEVRGKGFGI